MNFRGTAAALALLGLIAVGGCTSGTKPETGVTPSPTSTSPGGTPDALIGMWRVTDAAGEPAGSVLRLSTAEGLDLILFRKCGEFTGSWAAGTSGVFIGSVDGWAMACATSVQGDQPAPAWLADARAFRVRGSERDLVAANGSVLARLLPGGKPQPAPNLIGTLQQPPTPDPVTAERLRNAPRPLPAGVMPGTTSSLLGKWLPRPTVPSASGKLPFVEFAGDGSWKSYDGCNGGGGRWALGAAGEFVSVSGAIAGVGCAGPVTDVPVDRTRRVAISGNVLTLYDVEGKLLAHLTR